MADTGSAADEVRRLLLCVVRNPRRVAELPAARLDLALRLARRARLLARLAGDLERSGQLDSLPAAARDQLHSATIMADARARLARWELDRIAWAMRGRPDIELIALKGCAYLFLNVPQAAHRLFADVDLMTSEADLDEVERILNDYGWQTQKLNPYDQNYYRKWTHELPPLVHRERDMEIDLHHNVVPRTARLHPPAAEMLAAARDIDGVRYRVLADADIVLHAMTHLMFDSDLADKLRDLVDIDDLLRFFARRDPGFWDRLPGRADRLDLGRPAFYALRYCSRLLETPVPEALLAASRRWAPPGIVVQLMDRLVPTALFPQHPDRPTRRAGFARFLLYLRSHWIRMPPWLLAYHLTRKFIDTRLSRRPRH